MVYRFVEKSEKVVRGFCVAIRRQLSPGVPSAGTVSFSHVPGAGALLIPLFQNGVSMGAWWGANMNAHAQETASAIEILSLSGTTRMSVHPHV